MQNYNLKFKILPPLRFMLNALPLKIGFTLVELLVAVSVIAVIIAVVLPNFMGARQRARDERRKSDLRQIQNALELYKLDQSLPVYPTAGAFPASMCDACWDSVGDCSGNIYMRKFPCDPGGSGVSSYIYAPTAEAGKVLKYALTACLENPADKDKDTTAHASCTQTVTSYTINEP